jgi:5-methyltetrahydropteroyltriglutamate--homocysteine methyltransferase
MALLTTTIGAYSKPDFVTIPDWFRYHAGSGEPTPTERWAKVLEELGDQVEAMFARGTREVINDQLEAGIDIPTDGEVRRENYIHYHCRHLDGIDFENLSKRAIRGGVCVAFLPTVTGPVRARAHFLPRDWKLAQSFTDKPVKMTLPGPMTIADTIVDKHYGDAKRLGADVAAALNAEVLALAKAGCAHIQIDEPVFARRVDMALDYGIENLERAFNCCPDHVVRTVHICCGYPDRLNNPNYPKASQESYFRLAGAIDEASVMAVSIEDAHSHNDLKLLESFKSTAVVLGVIAVGMSRLEAVDEIRDRLIGALNHIDADRLFVAPDCGMGLLGRDLARKKLRNMCEAAHSIG